MRSAHRDSGTEARLARLRRGIATAESRDAVFDRVAELIELCAGPDLAFLALLPRGTRRMTIRSLLGDIDAVLRSTSVSLGGTAIGESVQTGRVRLHRARRDAAQVDLDALGRAGFRGCLIAPFACGLDVQGALVVTARGRLRWRRDIREDVERVAQLTAVALQRLAPEQPVDDARRERERCERMELLVRAARAMADVTDETTLFTVAALSASRLLSAHRVSLAVPHGEDRIRVFGYCGIGERFTLGDEFPAAGTAVERALRERSPQRWDLMEPERYCDHAALVDEGLRSTMLVPVESDDRYFGSLNVASMHAGAFRDEEEVILRHLGGFLGAALVSQRRRREAEHEREVAVQADRAKGLFLAAMSHEIRTPLNGLMGAADLMCETSIDGEQREMLETIRTSAERLRGILADIFDFTKIASNEMDLRARVVDVVEVVRVGVESFRRQAEERGLTLTFRHEGRERAVRVDDLRLRQIVENLVSNAVKFTDEGSIEVSCRVSRSSRPEERHVEISVRDTGRGISREKRGRLFEAFRNEARDPTTGRGLGLALSRALAGLLGGEIHVESDPGRGSTFHLVLDLAAASAAEAPGAEDWRPSRPLRVLVVDDNSINRMVVRRTLEKLGMETGVAQDGHEAIDAVAREPWDLVLMDLQMPRLDGFEATSRILGEGARAPVVVALTANATSGVRERCLQLGMTDFLTKPLQRERLVEVLQTIDEVPN